MKICVQLSNLNKKNVMMSLCLDYSLDEFFLAILNAF